MKDKFRLPRKIKKRLKNGFWLYPPDEDGNRTMAFPYKYKEDYDAFKQGIVKSFFNRNKEEDQKRKENLQALDTEIYVSDEKLKDYVNVIFAKPYRLASYSILLQAKDHPKAQKGYFNFINAYHKDKEEERNFGNICCLSVDYAREMLGPKGRNKTPQKKRRKRRLYR